MGHLRRRVISATRSLFGCAAILGAITGLPETRSIVKLAEEGGVA